VAKEVSLSFRTDRFRLTGELPPDRNAGNHMYGEDMAQWIVEQLPKHPFDYLDEDWGWLVLSGEAPDSRDPGKLVCHQLGVYAYPDDSHHAAGSDWGDWTLRLWKKEQRAVRILGLFPAQRWLDADVDQELAADLIAALAGIGISAVERSE
jgi:hypothetical protein